MSDVQLLFVVLAIIYGWECAWWLARGTSAFRTWYGKHWKLVQPGVLLGNQRGGLVFGHPLPPLGILLAANEFPLILSPQGVGIALFFDLGLPPLPGNEYFPWEKISAVESKGKNILLNSRVFLKTDSPFFAARIVEILLEIKKAKAVEREDLIRKRLKETVDTRRIEEGWADFKTQTRRLPLAANILFGHLFILSPALIGILGFRRSWLILLLALLGLTSTVAVLFHRAHKKLFPRLADERFSHFIIILLSPATAIRARDVLSRPLFSAYHPLALARVFCSPESFRAQAENFVRQGRYPSGVGSAFSGTRPQETGQDWQRLRQATLEDFIRGNGLDPEQLVRAPAPADETCLSYCPHCRAQFTSREGVCNDCGGLSLLPLPLQSPAQSNDPPRA